MKKRIKVRKMTKIKNTRAPQYNKIYVLSDIHIGTDYPSVWYRKEFHEPYLIRAIDYIISNASTVNSVVLLGDIFDFWLYPPHMKPPTIDDIIKANPNILGPNGKFVELLNALKGRVYFVNGNHDMNITQEDLNKIASKEYVIRHVGDILSIKLSEMYGQTIAFTHGHNFGIFNAPDKDMTKINIAPLPIGYFASRAYAYQFCPVLTSKPVADLPNNGYSDPDIFSFISFLFKAYLPWETFASSFASSLSKETGLSLNADIILPNGGATNLAKVGEMYSDLWSKWVKDNGGGNLGEFIAERAFFAEFKSNELAWFAQKIGLQIPAGLVVMGHTHEPKHGIVHGVVDYVNSGYMCPSKPDINSGKKNVTFVEINISDYNNIKAEVLGVVNKVFGNSMDSYGYYEVSKTNPPKDNIGDSSISDSSCYVCINNAQRNPYIHGEPPLYNVDMVRKEFSSLWGYYIVPPPITIPANTIYIFWLQNLPSGNGTTDGEVTYESYSGPVTYKYKCDGFGGANNCSPEDFKTKSGNNAGWSELSDFNEIKRTGDPFYIEFYSSNTVKGWMPNQSYSLDDVVVYNRNIYKCIKANTSNVDLVPPNDIYSWKYIDSLPASTPTI